MAIGAIAAGSGNAAYPAASALGKLGRIGSDFAQGSILYDVFNGHIQSALYDRADCLVFTNLTKYGAEASLGTLGASAATSALTMAAYANAGGSRGIVQSLVCTP